MKTKPLDLEELEEKWIEADSSLEDAIGEFVSESGFISLLEEDSEEFKERDRMILDIRELVSEQLKILFEEIKQKLKSACEFYLRYKDNPELLEEEHPELKDMVEEKFGEDIDGGCLNEDKYNEWLFKLAFKDVFKERDKHGKDCFHDLKNLRRTYRSVGNEK